MDFHFFDTLLILYRLKYVFDKVFIDFHALVSSEPLFILFSIFYIKNTLFFRSVIIKLQLFNETRTRNSTIGSLGGCFCVGKSGNLPIGGREVGRKR